MADDLRISQSDLKKLRDSQTALDDINRKLNIEAVGSAIGRVEAAFSLILQNVERVERLLELERGTPEQEIFREVVETLQGVLSGAERGLTLLSSIGDLIPIPGAESVLGALGLVGGGALGAKLAQGQEGRRILLERGLEQERNIRAQQQAELDRRLAAEGFDEKRELERLRQEQARTRALQ